MANTEITFYTHPSRWVNDLFPEEGSYDRIAGMAFENEELWADTSQLPHENSYRKTDTEALTINVPRDFALPIVDYFHDFYADPPRFYRVSDILKDYDQKSNCHRFGASVLKRCPQDILHAYAMAVEIATNKQDKIKHKLGDLAVLAFSENPYGFEHTFAAHTMVSLGDALPNQFIHTVAFNGNLAVSPIDPFLESYSQILPTKVSSQASSESIDPNPQAADDLKKIWTKKSF